MDNLITINNDLQLLGNLNSYECEAEKCGDLLSANRNTFNIFHMNIRSISCNFDSLLVLLKRTNVKIDVIVLTECWLQHINHIPTIPGYIAYSSKDPINRNDGVILYIWNEIQHNISYPVIVEASSIICTIDNSSFCLVAIYRSPSFRQTDRFCDSLNATLSSLNYFKHTILLGDINLNIAPNTMDNRSQEYLNLLHSHGFLSAHYFATHDNNCIDHFFVKSSLKYTTLVLNPSVTDHSPIIMSTDMNSPRQYFLTHKYLIDYPSIDIEIAKTDWSYVMDTDNANSAAELLVNSLSTIIKSNTRSTKLSRKNKIIKPWITPGLLRCIRNRDRLHKKFKASPTNDIIKTTYVRYRNFCNNLLKKLKRNYEKAEFDKAKNNMKATWEVIKKVANINTRSSSATDLLNLHQEPKMALNRVNDYFVGVGNNLAKKVRQNENYAPYTGHNDGPLNSFGLLPVDQPEIENIIINLKNSASVGWDGIPTRILKSNIHILAPLITHICNLSISQGIFPIVFKKAVIIPVYKSGDRSCVNNYRPISILPAISKILEKALNNRLINYLENKNLLASNQYGFRKGKSTEDAVLDLTEFITRSVDNNLKCTGVFLDLSKAFDTVSVPILLNKLESIGIRGIAHKIFSDYLINRSQQVKIGDYISDGKELAYGVPQGSILGPTLFLIYINDLCNLPVQNSKIIVYADDTVLLVTDKSWDDVMRRTEIMLEMISDWLSTNVLSLNVDKTKLITFSCSSRTQPLSSKCNIKFHSCKSASGVISCSCPFVPYVTDIKYLGVQIDNTLTWNLHIANITAKARKLIHIFRKLRSSADKSTLITVFHALAQSIFGYCITAWGSSAKTSVLRLERAQRAILKVMTRRPFRYSTLELYKSCKVLTVRQLYILQTILRKHKTITVHKHQIKRRYEIVCHTVKHRTLFARRHFYVSSSRIYNKVNKTIDIYTLTYNKCKTRVIEWLQTLSYEDTEKILEVVV